MEDNKIKVTFLGHAFFKVEADNKIVTFDPVDSESGYTFDSKIDTNLSCISHLHHDHNNTEILNIKNIDGFNKENNVKVIPSFHDEFCGAKRGTNDIHVVSIGEYKVCHLGDLGHNLQEDDIEAIGDIDILFIPVGGVYTIDGETAIKVLDKVRTKIVIPMHYMTDKLSFKLDSEEKFTIIARRNHQVINLYMNEITFTKDELNKINYDEKLIYVLKP